MKLNEIKNQAFEISYMANGYEVKLLAGLVVQLCERVEELEDAQEDAGNPEETEITLLLGKALGVMGETKKRLFTLWDLAKLAREAGVFEKEVGTVEDGKTLTFREDRVRGVDHGVMTPAQTSAFGKRISRQVGSCREVDGHWVVFGKRSEGRKAAYEVEVCDESSSPNDPMEQPPGGGTPPTRKPN